MCRGKVAPRSEEHLPDVLQLFWELQEKEYLGPDRLGVLKDVIGGLEEWSLLENVEKFETKRKEYHGLLEQIIQELELNDVEQLVSICKGKILDERQGNIRDVRSLFQELKNNSCLEINRLDILKEILRQTDKRDLLEKVKEFEERRNREHKSERRAARLAAVVSSASGTLTGGKM
ncbi:Casp8p [Porites harrisoni]